MASQILGFGFIAPMDEKNKLGPNLLDELGQSVFPKNMGILLMI